MTSAPCETSQNAGQPLKPVNMYRMNGPDASAFVTGPCGDSMEMYLIMQDGKITEAAFFSQGCEATLLCGAATAALAKGKTIMEALDLSPAIVIKLLAGLSEDHLHCSILAVNTLHSAVADYLLRVQRG